MADDNKVEERDENQKAEASKDKPAEKKSETPKRDKARKDRKDREDSFPVGQVHGGENYEAVEPEEADDSLLDHPAGSPDDGILVTVHNKRSDKDLIQGQFVNVVKGEHKGRSGVFVKPVEFGKDRYPSKILVRTDDDEHQLLVLRVSSCELKKSAR